MLVSSDDGADGADFETAPTTAHPEPISPASLGFKLTSTHVDPGVCTRCGAASNKRWDVLRNGTLLGVLGFVACTPCAEAAFTKLTAHAVEYVRRMREDFREAAMRIWWRVVWNRLCFAVITEADRVVQVAPVGDWMMGRPWGALAVYLKARGAQIQRLPDERPA